MSIRKTNLAIIGAGPAGLAAAIEAARAGVSSILIDENEKPGGQLFKQIHKFFGSSEHRAGVRGYEIGQQLLKETSALGVEALLGAAVYGIFQQEQGLLISYQKDGHEQGLLAKTVILATGAAENALVFPGCTLPGVMGAGCAQTMVNVNRVLPGKNIVMVGSGNVGLIVSYQLMQAGANVLALVEAAPSIGGYGVHAAKIRRAGVPFLLGHTIRRAMGADAVEAVEVVALDEKFQQIPGTEQIIPCDTVCIAVGLSPMTELACMAGCEFAFIGPLGGHIPLHDENMATTVPGLYVAGDIAGAEEASTAMEEGRLAGIAAAEALGHYSLSDAAELKAGVWRRMDSLRTGPFGQKRKDCKDQMLRLARDRKEQGTREVEE